MSFIEIDGGNELNGKVKIQGSKNTVLPIIAATILCEGVTNIYNCPRITDVYSMVDILRNMGCKVDFEGNILTIDSTHIDNCDILPSFTGKLRSSIIFMGPLLARCKEAKIGYPGGCMIGARPIDIHLNSFMQMNVGIVMDKNTINFQSYFLKGTDLTLRFPSVGATQNVMLAATKALGTTRIKNAAKEPEIVELAEFLNNMGAKILGAGTDELVIDGVEELHAVDYTVPYDRIVAGTYMLSTVAAKGEIYLQNINSTDKISNIIYLVKRLGGEIQIFDNEIKVAMVTKPQSVNIYTGPYPDIPTDIQSMILAVISVADGKSVLYEGVFEKRYTVVEQLKKMGALIDIDGNYAYVHGNSNLSGAKVSATDLRGGAALCIAGLVAKNTSVIDNIEYIKRGYEDIVGDLQLLNAKIRYIDC